MALRETDLKGFTHLSLLNHRHTFSQSKVGFLQGRQAQVDGMAHDTERLGVQGGHDGYLQSSVRLR